MPEREPLIDIAQQRAADRAQTPPPPDSTVRRQSVIVEWDTDDDQAGDVVILDDPAEGVFRVRSLSEAIVAAGGVTNEETFFDWYDDTSALADATRKRFLCPFDLEVTGVSVTSLAAVSANATNYWKLDVRKIIATDLAHTPLSIASKTTQLEPAGEAFLPFTPWTFDTVEFDPVNRFCVRGDQIDILWTKTLSPTAPSRLAGYITYRAV